MDAIGAPDPIITVDGRRIAARAGETLLAVLRRNGVEVPTLCQDGRLEPYGACRLCVVARRDGGFSLIPACSTPVEDGMVVDTAAAEVIESRRWQLRYLLSGHRLECPVCRRGGDCRLQDLIHSIGVPGDALPMPSRAPASVDRDALIGWNADKCVLCGTCFRLCDEVQGVGELRIAKGSPNGVPVGFRNRPLDCEFCGQCVDACPVAALSARPFRTAVAAWMRDSVRTTCSFCSCGCQVDVESFAGRLQRVTATLEAGPNRGSLCAKGRFGWDVLAAPDRVTQPLVRRHGRLAAVDWEEALSVTAAGLAAATGDGRAVVGIGSPRLTTEDAYLFQRLLRQVLRSPHVGIGPAAGARALMKGVQPVLGQPRSTATFVDLRRAEAVLVVRGDPTRSHPLVKTELVTGGRKRGQRLILAHALSGGLERHADLFLGLPPLGEEVLLYGLAHLVLEMRPDRAEALAATDGFEPFRRDVRCYDPGAVAAALRVPEEELRAAAGMLAGAGSVVGVVVTGLGIPGDEAAVTRAMAQLLLVLGCESGPGRGVLVLGEKANLQGVIDAGGHPGCLPGWRRAVDASSAVDLQKRWGGRVAAGCGWDHWEALQHAVLGEVGALYLVGQDPVGAWARGDGARAGVEAAGFVVVQDAFLTETAALADVVLPARILGERDGTVASADGARRRLRAALPAPPGTAPDGEIFAEIARRLGDPLPGGAALETELDAVLPRHDEPPVAAAFVRLPTPPRRPLRAPSMLFDAAPQLFHSGSVTTHSRLLQELAPAVALHLCPADAARLGATGGELVRVATAEREALLRVRVDPRVRPGSAMALWQSSGGGAAALMSTEDDVVEVEIRPS